MMVHQQVVHQIEIIQLEMGLQPLSIMLTGVDHLIHLRLLMEVDHLTHHHQDHQMMEVGDHLDHHHLDLKVVSCLICSHSVNINEYFQILLVMVIMLNTSTLKRK
jgi:hypothetical protein